MSPGAASAAAVVPALAASITSTFTDLATNLVGDLGLIGVFVLMLLDSACVPVPSEVTMLFAGFEVSSGRYHLASIIAVGILGNVVGSQVAYGVGYFGRVELVERYADRLHLHPSQLRRAERWFDRYGAASVLIARILPVVRTFISLPAGFARMPFVRFSGLTLLGCIPWVTAWAVIGDVVGDNWSRWKDHLRYADYVIVGLIVIAVLVIAIRRWRRRHDAPAN